MLRRAEKNVLFTIFATALIGLTGMRTSFSVETTKEVKQSMEESAYSASRCEYINGKMECVENNKVENAVE